MPIVLDPSVSLKERIVVQLIRQLLCRPMPNFEIGLSTKGEVNCIDWHGRIRFGEYAELAFEQLVSHSSATKREVRIAQLNLSHD
jgi:hypothetical protein